ncbi:Tetratricopeptide repeat domain protein [Myxococcus hansupus]|uniref:Tetratricopeptide repeat domain protein n=1 Tax=Pseudomyxococcus hansupus TaxID=1297742 RepID=A0A0H4WR27_9BACT|nr:tetratricopeptide repeat protein [Myxococcus hansupus]AKQ65956.1 Tetratricopeptide repeat domain protein [Myxococcus hansupus]
MHPALPLLLLALSGAASTPGARQLNTQGFRLYQAGRYPEALERFQEASKASPDYALAHYNLAATLGVLRKQGKVCEYSAHRDVIVEHLTRAVALDARRLTRAREDADFEPIRDTLGWQKLLGRDPAREQDVPLLLRAVSWFGPGVGVYGTLQRLRFEPGGRATLRVKEVDAEGTPRERQVRGRYTVSGRQVDLRLEGRPPTKGTLTETGALTFPGWETFTDAPSECEA